MAGLRTLRIRLNINVISFLSFSSIALLKMSLGRLGLWGHNIRQDGTKAGGVAPRPCQSTCPEQMTDSIITSDVLVLQSMSHQITLSCPS